MAEGSSATDSVTDVTDVSPMEVGRRQKAEGRMHSQQYLQRWVAMVCEY